ALQTLQKELNETFPTAEKHRELQEARKFADFQTEVKQLAVVWEKKPFAIRKEFVNVFVKQAVIRVESTHWVRLEIQWAHPAWAANTLFIRRRHGEHEVWTEEEKAILRIHYFTADQPTFLQLLPTKTWRGL